jgi:ribonuclease P protein component, eubacterial
MTKSSSYPYQQRHTLPRSERIKSRDIINRLFDSGQSIFVYPLKLIYIKVDTPSPHPIKVGVTVPKRNHKKATQRNRLKRRLREAYRKNKPDIKEAEHHHYAIMYILVDRKETSYELIGSAMRKVNKKFMSII